MRKQIRNAVLLAAAAAWAITSSVSTPAWAEESQPTSRMNINYDSQHHFFYHPPSYYDPTIAPETSHGETERTPVSKKYDSAFVKSKPAAAKATAVATAVASETVSDTPVQLVPITVVAPQGDVPTTPEQKAAQMHQDFGIPASDLQGLSMQQLTDLDMKIRTIQRLQYQYKIAPETLVHHSLDALQKLEWKLQQGR